MAKICSCCKEEKEYYLFGKDKRTNDGYVCYCKDCVKIKTKINSVKYADIRKVKREQNKDKIKAYRKATTEHRKVKKREWVINNKQKIRDYENRYRSKYRIKRKKVDTLFKVKCNLRNRISKIFTTKGYKKKGSSASLLGAEYVDVKKFLENKFLAGMSWENYGDWEIDHVTPLAVAKNEKELLELCHYTNLQPLWKIDNQIKGARIYEQKAA